MLQVDAQSRTTLDELLEHPWMGGTHTVPWLGLDETEWTDVAL